MSLNGAQRVRRHRGSLSEFLYELPLQARHVVYRPTSVYRGADEVGVF